MYGGSFVQYEAGQKLENLIDNTVDDVFHFDQGDLPVKIGKYSLKRQFDGTVQVDEDGTDLLKSFATKQQLRHFLQENLTD